MSGPTIPDLHARYDGPVPKHMREAAMAGSYLRLARDKAWARVRFWHQYLRRNRRIRHNPRPNWEQKNAADLAYALKWLHRARTELRIIEKQGEPK